MRTPFAPRRRAARWGSLSSVLLALVVVALAFIMTASMAPAGSGTPASAARAPGGVVPSTGAPARAMPSPSHAAPLAAPVARPAATTNETFNPPCFPISKIACVRVATAAMPDIVPTGNNHSATIQPLYTDNIELLVMSEINLIPTSTNVITEGDHAAAYLNITEILWNGDPYFCYCDDSDWHSNNNTWYIEDTAREFQNATYPYVYDLWIANRSVGQNGVPSGPQFFPGATVTWQVTVSTPNAADPSEPNETRSVPFTYRISGAWAFSPHPGAAQYAGSNASTGDLNLRWTPRAPNWNDSVLVTISTTIPDIENGAAIGMATLYIEEYHLGKLTANATLVSFPIGHYLNATGILIPGNNTANATIPRSFAQVAGDEIVFWVVAQDNAKYSNDTISYPAQSYVVNGNGTFPTGIFADDVEVTTTPKDVANPPVNPVNGTLETPLVAPGQNVSVLVQSLDPQTSLFSVLIDETMYYAPLDETAGQVIPLSRVNSTAFSGILPGMPVSASVSFTVQAVDYSFHLDQSTPYPYDVQSFENYTTAYLPSNESFFYVYVYNNGSSSYVSGATVQIRGPTPAFNTLAQTQFGIAYPNATGQNFRPLVVAANASYNITVTDAIIGSSTSSHSTSVEVLATNPQLTMDNQHLTLARGSDYIVVQEGSSIFFWLNGSLSSTVSAPSVEYANGPGLAYEVAEIAGLVAAAAVAFFLWKWFDRIIKRRKAEERRVTL